MVQKFKHFLTGGLAVTLVPVTRLQLKCHELLLVALYRFKLPERLGNVGLCVNCVCIFFQTHRHTLGLVLLPSENREN